MNKLLSFTAQMYSYRVIPELRLQSVCVQPDTSVLTHNADHKLDTGKGKVTARQDIHRCWRHGEYSL